MTKEEFLAMSLPYGLKLYNRGAIYNELHYESNDFQKKMTIPEAIKIKPILYPLYCLTRPITHKGETLVPAIKLAKIVAGIYNDDMDSEWILRDNGIIICKTPWDLHISIYYKTESVMFSVYDMWNRQEKRTRNQFVAFQKLIEWHFDISGLIEKEEAIDVNTLDKNPYA